MFKKKLKKKHIVLLVILSLLLLGFFYLIYKGHVNSTTAYVEKVSDLNTGFDESSYNGFSASITDENASTFNLAEDKTVSEVYVKVGDKVSAGTKLFSYDTTDLKNELNAQKALLDSTTKQLTLKQELLKYYENLTPISTEKEEVEEEDSADSESEMSNNEATTDLPSVENSLTQEEKSSAIKETNEDIASLTSSINSTKVSIQSLQQKIDDSIVTSLVSGIVKTVGDPSKPQNTGTPFLTLGSDSGVIVQGYLDEYSKDDFKVGEKLTVNNYMNNATSTAKITMISDYPAPQNVSDDGKKNVSHYEFKAFLKDSKGFHSGDSVNLSKKLKNSESAIVLDHMYVRSDDKGHYCMKRGKKNRLEKAYVDTKYISDTDSFLITDGIKDSDYIAFPYGKKGQVGCKTTTKNSFSINKLLGM
ncbi:MAG: HlyD family secretion protein [Lachnospiraceae bacterium]|nr:HlyD family secretion protein [Lachnospiraceae bacterium]